MNIHDVSAAVNHRPGKLKMLGNVFINYTVERFQHLSRLTFRRPFVCEEKSALAARGHGELLKCVVRCPAAAGGIFNAKVIVRRDVPRTRKTLQIRICTRPTDTKSVSSIPTRATYKFHRGENETIFIQRARGHRIRKRLECNNSDGRRPSLKNTGRARSPRR